MLVVNPQASSIGKPVSWNGLYLSIAEVQVCDIKPAKIDMKKRVVCRKAVFSVSKTCDYQRGIYVLTVYLDIPVLSDTYHCTQSNCTTTRGMPEHPLTNSHSHHSQWEQSNLIFQV